MTPDEIVELAIDLNGKGLKTIVLQSGEDPYYTGEMIADVVRRIKAATDMAITLCVGERPYEDYKLWKEAGADRYLLRHETASRELIRQAPPRQRLRQPHALPASGCGSSATRSAPGAWSALPGQTIEHLADDIEFFRDFQPDMAGIGPYIPHPDTPFAGCATGDAADDAEDGRARRGSSRATRCFPPPPPSARSRSWAARWRWRRARTS